MLSDVIMPPAYIRTYYIDKYKKAAYINSCYNLLDIYLEYTLSDR